MLWQYHHYMLQNIGDVPTDIPKPIEALKADLHLGMYITIFFYRRAPALSNEIYSVVMWTKDCGRSQPVSPREFTNLLSLDLTHGETQSFSFYLSPLLLKLVVCFLFQGLSCSRRPKMWCTLWHTLHRRETASAVVQLFAVCSRGHSTSITRSHEKWVALNFFRISTWGSLPTEIHLVPVEFP